MVNISRRDLADMTPNQRASTFLMALRERADEYDRQATNSQTVADAVRFKELAETHRQLATEFHVVYWPNN
jgi:hypothetical protein